MYNTFRMENDNKPNSLLWVAVTCPATTEGATREILRNNGVVLSECELPDSTVMLDNGEKDEGTLFEGICSTNNIASVVGALQASEVHREHRGKRGSILTQNVNALPEHSLDHTDLILDFEIKFSRS